MTIQATLASANNAINPVDQNPAKNDKQNVGWLRWGVSLVTAPICYLAKHAWIVLKSIGIFVVSIFKAPFCYLKAALSNKSDVQKPAPAQPRQSTPVKANSTRTQTVASEHAHKPPMDKHAGVQHVRPLHSDQNPPIATSHGSTRKAAAQITFAKADVKTQTQQWLNFYQSPDQNYPGTQWSLNKILELSDHQLAITAGALQLLMPIYTKSIYSPHAPLMNDSIAEVVKEAEANSQIRKNIDRTINRVLDFMGLKRHYPECATLNPNHKEKHNKWNGNQPNSEGEKQVSRFLNFLMATGHERLACSIDEIMNLIRKENHHSECEIWTNIALPNQGVSQPQQIAPSQKGLNANTLPSVTRFCLDFTKNSNTDQARKILLRAQALLRNNPDLPGVAITYSANHDQTVNIINTYGELSWYTGTNGSHQANVMHEMEELLKTDEFQTLQGKMRIAPITTMKPNGKPASDKEFNVSIKNMKTLTSNHWHIIGWQNQGTVNNADMPFAIGGGVSKVMPVEHQRIIQNHLKQLANMP